LRLKELLTVDGSMYVHLDWHVSHYAKAILDEVFGYENFVNEIVWKRSDAHNDKSLKTYGSIHDVILYYRNNPNNYIWNRGTSKIEDKTIDRDYRVEEATGRHYRLGDLAGPGGRGVTYEINGLRKAWKWTEEKFRQADKDGKIYYTNTGRPFYKIYLDEHSGVPLQTLWLDCPQIKGGEENVKYPTQKPVALLERIIKASSNEGDLILDSFCGSGTTAAAAEKLNRRWITCDPGRFAIHTARKRFLGIENVKPFIVQNLGKYERQQWMIAEFDLTPDPSPKKGEGNNATMQKRLEQERSYKHFITELYHAKPLDGYTWLHGAKAGRMIHVGSVEAPVTVEDIKAAIKEFWKLVGKHTPGPSQEGSPVKTNGIDFLGWDFAFDVNETAKQFAAENKVNISFKKIPREVLEKKAVEQGDIKFYELASLSIKTKKNKKNVSLTLDNFIIPPDDVPEEVQGKITHWSQWIDYWAVDWNYRDDTFHNEWQSYRTKQKSNIELSASKNYDEPGKYTILVKVIDILGNDTTKAIGVEL